MYLGAFTTDTGSINILMPNSDNLAIFSKT